MASINVRSSAIIPASAPVVYRLLADYHVGHPSILPSQYFEDLVVEEGGVGEGTVLRFTMRAFGARQLMRGRVTEPHPGRTLVETYDNGTETHFIVEPVSDTTARVTFETFVKPRSGLQGWIERLVTPGYLRKVYTAELSLLAERALGTRGASA